MRSGERLLLCVTLGLSSVLPLNVSANTNVDIPVSVTYTAKLSLSTTPQSIDFGSIIPQDVVFKPLDISIEASHNTSLYVSMEASNRVDDETSTIGGAHFKVKLDPALGWGNYFKLDNSLQLLSVVSGSTTLKTEIELNTTQTGSITPGTFNSQLRISIKHV